MSPFITLVLVGVVAAVVYAALTIASRRGLNLWHRRKPFTIQVNHLPHVPPEVAGQKAPDGITVEVGRIVREPWAVSLAGPLPDRRSFEATNPTPSQAHAWLRSHGGVDYRETKLRLSLTSNTHERILIRGIRVEVQHREPLAGTHVYCPTAGAAKATLLIFELDEQVPQAKQWTEDGARRKVSATPYFAHNHVLMKKDETCDFVIVGSARKSYARWRLVVDYEIGRHRKTLHISDGVDWFLTSGDPPGGFATRLHWAWYAGNGFLPEPRASEPHSSASSPVP